MFLNLNLNLSLKTKQLSNDVRVFHLCTVVHNVHRQNTLTSLANCFVFKFKFKFKFKNNQKIPASIDATNLTSVNLTSFKLFSQKSIVYYELGMEVGMKVVLESNKYSLGTQINKKSKPMQKLNKKCYFFSRAY